jgi:glycosyltransferase involved in cell wall biosynthesis
MLVEIPRLRTPAARDIDVLWVGNLRPVKRPELVLELARALPNRRFVLAGGPLPKHKTYFDEIKSLASGLPNVEMLGPVNYEDVGPLFERARLHLNTSSAEGFPNTFLQAWARCVPVVSFFDPDNLIERRNFGRKCRDTEEMVGVLHELLANTTMCEEIGRRARSFVEAEFSPRAIAQRYLELLEDERSSAVTAQAAVASARR